jgi:hypothetical protein
MDILKKLFEQHFRAPLIRVQPLQGHLGGSGRTIVRLIGENATAIGVRYSVREENVAFLDFTRHFRRHGLPVPQIYAEDLSRGAYIEEDLGDTTLFEFLLQNRAGAKITPEVIAAYRKVVDTLPRFQVEAGRDLNYAVCCPRARFDRQSIAWDLNYFKYYFLKVSGIPFSEQAMEDDFGRLTDDAGQRAVLPGLPGRAQGRAALRHCVSLIRRQGGPTSEAAGTVAGPLHRQAGRFH